MNRGKELLSKITPYFGNDVPVFTTPNKIFGQLYSQGIINNLLDFVSRIKRNIEKRSNGLDMCSPFITWKIQGKVPTMTCMDNYLIFESLRSSIIGKYIDIINQFQYMWKSSNAQIYYIFQGKLYNPNAIVENEIGEMIPVKNALNANIFFHSRFKKICYPCGNNNAAIESLLIEEVGSIQDLNLIHDTVSRKMYNKSSTLLITADYLIDPSYNQLQIPIIELPINSTIITKKLYTINNNEIINSEIPYSNKNNNHLNININQIGFKDTKQINYKEIILLEIKSPRGDYNIRYLLNIYYNTSYITDIYDIHKTKINSTINTGVNTEHDLIIQHFSNKINIDTLDENIKIGFINPHVDINLKNNDILKINKSNLIENIYEYVKIEDLENQINIFNNHVNYSDNFNTDNNLVIKTRYLFPNNYSEFIPIRSISTVKSKFLSFYLMEEKKLIPISLDKNSISVPMNCKVKLCGNPSLVYVVNGKVPSGEFIEINKNTFILIMTDPYYESTEIIDYLSFIPNNDIVNIDNDIIAKKNGIFYSSISLPINNNLLNNINLYSMYDILQFVNHVDGKNITLSGEFYTNDTIVKNNIELNNIDYVVKLNNNILSTTIKGDNTNVDYGYIIVNTLTNGILTPLNIIKNIGTDSIYNNNIKLNHNSDKIEEYYTFKYDLTTTLYFDVYSNNKDAVYYSVDNLNYKLFERNLLWTIGNLNNNTLSFKYKNKITNIIFSLENTVSFSKFICIENDYTFLSGGLINPQNSNNFTLNNLNCQSNINEIKNTSKTNSSNYHDTILCKSTMTSKIRFLISKISEDIEIQQDNNLINPINPVKNIYEFNVEKQVCSFVVITNETRYNYTIQLLYDDPYLQYVSFENDSKKYFYEPNLSNNSIILDKAKSDYFLDMNYKLKSSTLKKVTFCFNKSNLKSSNFNQNKDNPKLFTLDTYKLIDNNKLIIHIQDKSNKYTISNNFGTDDFIKIESKSLHKKNDYSYNQISEIESITFTFNSYEELKNLSLYYNKQEDGNFKYSFKFSNGQISGDDNNISIIDNNNTNTEIKRFFEYLLYDFNKPVSLELRDTSNYIPSTKITINTPSLTISPSNISSNDYKINSDNTINILSHIFNDKIIFLLNSQIIPIDKINLNIYLDNTKLLFSQDLINNTQLRITILPDTSLPNYWSDYKNINIFTIHPLLSPNNVLKIKIIDAQPPNPINETIQSVNFYFYTISNEQPTKFTIPSNASYISIPFDNQHKPKPIILSNYSINNELFYIDNSLSTFNIFISLVINILKYNPKHIYDILLNNTLIKNKIKFLKDNTFDLENLKLILNINQVNYIKLRITDTDGNNVEHDLINFDVKPQVNIEVIKDDEITINNCSQLLSSDTNINSISDRLNDIKLKIQNIYAIRNNINILYNLETLTDIGNDNSITLLKKNNSDYIKDIEAYKDITNFTNLHFINLISRDLIAFAPYDVGNELKFKLQSYTLPTLPTIGTNIGNIINISNTTSTYNLNVFKDTLIYYYISIPTCIKEIDNNNTIIFNKSSPPEGFDLILFNKKDKPNNIPASNIIDEKNYPMSKLVKMFMNKYSFKYTSADIPSIDKFIKLKSNTYINGDGTNFDIIKIDDDLSIELEFELDTSIFGTYKIKVASGNNIFKINNNTFTLSKNYQTVNYKININEITLHSRSPQLILSSNNTNIFTLNLTYNFNLKAIDFKGLNQSIGIVKVPPNSGLGPVTITELITISKTTLTLLLNKKINPTLTNPNTNIAVQNNQIKVRNIKKTEDINFTLECSSYIKTNICLKVHYSPKGPNTNFYKNANKYKGFNIEYISPVQTVLLTGKVSKFSTDNWGKDNATKVFTHLQKENVITSGDNITTIPTYVLDLSKNSCIPKLINNKYYDFLPINNTLLIKYIYENTNKDISITKLVTNYFNDGKTYSNNNSRLHSLPNDKPYQQSVTYSGDAISQKGLVLIKSLLSDINQIPIIQIVPVNNNLVNGPSNYLSIIKKNLQLQWNASNSNYDFIDVSIPNVSSANINAIVNNNKQTKLPIIFNYNNNIPFYGYLFNNNVTFNKNLPSLLNGDGLFKNFLLSNKNNQLYGINVIFPTNNPFKIQNSLQNTLLDVIIKDSFNYNLFTWDYYKAMYNLGSVDMDKPIPITIITSDPINTTIKLIIGNYKQPLKPNESHSYTPRKIYQFTLVITNNKNTKDTKTYKFKFDPPTPSIMTGIELYNVDGPQPKPFSFTPVFQASNKNYKIAEVLSCQNVDLKVTTSVKSDDDILYNYLDDETPPSQALNNEASFSLENLKTGQHTLNVYKSEDNIYSLTFNYYNRYTHPVLNTFVLCDLNGNPLSDKVAKLDNSFDSQTSNYDILIHDTNPSLALYFKVTWVPVDILVCSDSNNATMVSNQTYPLIITSPMNITILNKINTVQKIYTFKSIAPQFHINLYNKNKDSISITPKYSEDVYDYNISDSINENSIQVCINGTINADAFYYRFNDAGGPGAIQHIAFGSMVTIPIPLNPGTNVLDIYQLMNKDGLPLSKAYKFTFTYEPLEPVLTSFELCDKNRNLIPTIATLKPEFSSNTVNYTINIFNTTVDIYYEVEFGTGLQVYDQNKPQNKFTNKQIVQILNSPSNFVIHVLNTETKASKDYTFSIGQHTNNTPSKFLTTEFNIDYSHENPQNTQILKYFKDILFNNIAAEPSVVNNYLNNNGCNYSISIDTTDNFAPLYNIKKLIVDYGNIDISRASDYLLMYTYDSKFINPDVTKTNISYSQFLNAALNLKFTISDAYNILYTKHLANTIHEYTGIALSQTTKILTMKIQIPNSSYYLMPDKKGFNKTNIMDWMFANAHYTLLGGDFEYQIQSQYQGGTTWMTFNKPNLNIYKYLYQDKSINQPKNIYMCDMEITMGANGILANLGPDIFLNTTNVDNIQSPCKLEISGVRDNTLQKATVNYNTHFNSYNQIISIFHTSQMDINKVVKMNNNIKMDYNSGVFPYFQIYNEPNSNFKLSDFFDAIKLKVDNTILNEEKLKFYIQSTGLLVNKNPIFSLPSITDLVTNNLCPVRSSDFSNWGGTYIAPQKILDPSQSISNFDGWYQMIDSYNYYCINLLGDDFMYISNRNNTYWNFAVVEDDDKPKPMSKAWDTWANKNSFISNDLEKKYNNIQWPAPSFPLQVYPSLKKLNKLNSGIFLTYVEDICDINTTLIGNIQSIITNINCEFTNKDVLNTLNSKNDTSRLTADKMTIDESIYFSLPFKRETDKITYFVNKLNLQSKSDIFSLTTKFSVLSEQFNTDHDSVAYEKKVIYGTNGNNPHFDKESQCSNYKDLLQTYYTRHFFDNDVKKRKVGMWLYFTRHTYPYINSKSNNLISNFIYLIPDFAINKNSVLYTALHNIKSNTLIVNNNNYIDTIQYHLHNAWNPQGWTVAGQPPVATKGSDTSLSFSAYSYTLASGCVQDAGPEYFGGIDESKVIYEKSITDTDITSLTGAKPAPVQWINVIRPAMSAFFVRANMHYVIMDQKDLAKNYSNNILKYTLARANQGSSKIDRICRPLLNRYTFYHVNQIFNTDFTSTTNNYFKGLFTDLNNYTKDDKNSSKWSTNNKSDYNGLKNFTSLLYSKSISISKFNCCNLYSYIAHFIAQYPLQLSYGFPYDDNGNISTTAASGNIQDVNFTINNGEGVFTPQSQLSIPSIKHIVYTTLITTLKRKSDNILDYIIPTPKPNISNYIIKRNTKDTMTLDIDFTDFNNNNNNNPKDNNSKLLLNINAKNVNAGLASVIDETIGAVPHPPYKCSKVSINIGPNVTQSPDQPGDTYYMNIKTGQADNNNFLYYYKNITVPSPTRNTTIPKSWGGENSITRPLLPNNPTKVAISSLKFSNLQITTSDGTYKVPKTIDLTQMKNREYNMPENIKLNDKTITKLTFDLENDLYLNYFQSSFCIGPNYNVPVGTQWHPNTNTITFNTTGKNNVPTLVFKLFQTAAPVNQQEWLWRINLVNSPYIVEQPDFSIELFDGNTQILPQVKFSPTLFTYKLGKAYDKINIKIPNNIPSSVFGLSIDGKNIHQDSEHRGVVISTNGVDNQIPLNGLKTFYVIGYQNSAPSIVYSYEFNFPNAEIKTNNVEKIVFNSDSYNKFAPLFQLQVVEPPGFTSDPKFINFTIEDLIQDK